MNSVPAEIDDIERKIKQLEIEREAIKREGDTSSLQKLSKEIADLTDERNILRAKWQSEKAIIDDIQQNKSNIESLKFEAEQAERQGDYGKVAEIRYGKIKDIENKIESLKNKLKELHRETALIKEEVSTEDIAEIVSKWTGIPVTKMLQKDKEKLLNLENELHKRVVGQDEAISIISNAIRRGRAGLQDAKRPVGSFIFLGTTGVGKTELAKALAEFLFNDENLLTRIDMSEYQERHSVSRLIGAPPGYIGYEEGGQLTEAVRRKPYSVILLDEIEKAHADVFNILLQVLDDGRLTDNKGRTVNFRNTIIIMTSNIGSHIIQENMQNMNDKNSEEVFGKTRNQVFELLKKTVRPEFLNRIDEIIMFKPLKQKEIIKIVELNFNDIAKLMADNDIIITISKSALDWIAEQGYDPQFGARPMKRVMQRTILNELSKQMLEGNVDKGKVIRIDKNENKLIFKNEVIKTT